MHILFLTQIVPYPPDAGPKVKTWNVIRYLVGLGYKVTLVTFVRAEEEDQVVHLENLCHQVYTVPMRRSRVEDFGYFLRSIFTGRPFLIERDDLKEMRSVLENLFESEHIDIIHADQLTMTQFALRVQNHNEEPFLIFDAHNAVWTILEKMAENLPWYLKPFAAFEARKVKRYEGNIVNEFDHTFAVTELDRSSLLSAARSAANGRSLADKVISVVPIAVDTHNIEPVQLVEKSKSILTLGTLHYPPNADGIRWFFEEVFPLVRKAIPDTHLTIIGKNPPQDFIRFAEQNSEQVEVTGYVPDLEPYLKQAAVLVIPVRAGGGMRVRILEGFAYGEAIVTTTVGLEGIEAEPGKEVLVADSPGEFAEAVISLLEKFELRKEIAQSGRKLVERSYDWQVVLQDMDDIYQGVGLSDQKDSVSHE
jgi:glycosyltransferase involved in cell wall biosynthesis